jgi:DNA adenine methylase
MTYDDDDVVETMALQHGFAVARIPMKNTHHAKMYELLIGRNLSWLPPA